MGMIATKSSMDSREASVSVNMWQVNFLSISDLEINIFTILQKMKKTKFLTINSWSTSVKVQIKKNSIGLRRLISQEKNSPNKNSEMPSIPDLGSLMRRDILVRQVALPMD